MKKITVPLSILIILLIAVPQVMAKRVGFRSFTQMQAQNGASYADGDSATIITLQDDATYPSETHSCTLDADSGAVEALPTVVSFSSNANDKRFLCERIDGMASGTTAGGDLTGTYPNPTIAVNSVNDTHMDWGVGADQVSAVDVPIADGGSIITGIEVETALQENRGAINTNTGLAHAESHTVVSHSDTTATGTELETLTDTSDASGLHNHTTANLNDTTATGTELTELTDGSVTTEHDHSRLAASDGTPNNAIDCDASGDCTASGDITGAVLYIDGIDSAGDIATDGRIVQDFPPGKGNVALGGATTGNDTMTGSNNNLVGPGAGASLTSGLQNNFMGTGSGANATTGTRNVGVGQLSAENITTANNTVTIGYSMLNTTTGDAIVGVGTHACSAFYDFAAGVANQDDSYNSCYGHSASASKAYLDFIWLKGEWNTFIGSKSAPIPAFDNSDANEVNHTSTLGYGAGFGTKEWNYVTSDMSSNTPPRINMTSQPYSDGDFIVFRGAEPDAFDENNAGSFCALADDVYFKVIGSAANSFDIQWCRTLYGLEDMFAQEVDAALPAVTVTGCVAGPTQEYVRYDAAHGIADDTLIIHNTLECTSIEAGKAYYACNTSITDGTTPLASTDLSYKTITGDCGGGSTSNYLNITGVGAGNDGNTYTAITADFDTCNLWTSPSFARTYVKNTKTYGFDEECNDLLVSQTAVVELEAAKTSYSYSTAIGSDSICDSNDAVCLGREGVDDIYVGDVLLQTAKDASATPIATTTPIKRWSYVEPCADQADATACFTFPQVTTTGMITCAFYGTDTGSCEWTIDENGAVIIQRDSDTADCDDANTDAKLNVIDGGGTLAILNNRLGQTESILCEMIYD